MYGHLLWIANSASALETRRQIQVLDLNWMSCGTGNPAQLVMKAGEIPEINGGFMGKIVIYQFLLVISILDYTFYKWGDLVLIAGKMQ